MKKRIISLLIILVYMPNLLACELCKKNQPAILQDITHGQGPQGMWDYAIIYIAIAVVAIVLFFSIKFLVKPGEKDPNHIKNIVVNLNQLRNEQ